MKNSMPTQPLLRGKSEKCELSWIGIRLTQTEDFRADPDEFGLEMNKGGVIQNRCEKSMCYRLGSIVKVVFQGNVKVS